MLTKSIEVLAGDLKLKNIASGGTKDERAYGIYRKYLLAVSERDGKKTAVFSCPFDTDEDSVFTFEFSQALTETLKEISECVCTVEKDGVTISSSCKISDFRAMIDAAADMLEANEIPCSDKCSVCGTSFDHKKIMVMNKDGVLSLICESCALSESLDNNKKKAAAKASSAQRGKGILGALLGAVIGILAIVGIFYLADMIVPADISLTYVFSALCFGSAAVVFLFSKLFCKPKDIWVTVSVCIFALLFNAGGRILVSAYQVLTALGYSLSTAMRAPMTFIRLPFGPHLEGVDVTQALIIDALFGLVALAIFAFGLFNSEKKRGFSIEQYIK